MRESSWFWSLEVLCVFWRNKGVFSAVAVSGTASLFLAPVVFFSIFTGKDNVPVWSLLVSFVLAILGATIYFLESSGYSAWLGDIQKHTMLLYISAFVLVTGCCAFWPGIKINRLSA